VDDDRREQLHRLVARLLAHGQEVLGRWADVMVNSGIDAYRGRSSNTQGSAIHAQRRELQDSPILLRA